MIDQHTHTMYSFDSSQDLEDSIQAAINAGIEHLAFTDHWDFHATSKGNNNEFEVEKRNEHIEELKEKYKEKIHLLRGVELGIQPATIELNREFLNQHHFDYVIGSVHAMDEKDIYSEQPIESFGVPEYRRYYENIYEAVLGTKGINTLGHIDYLDRYMKARGAEIPEFSTYEEIIEKILKLLIERNVALELNTAGLRSGLPYVHPKPETLQKYHELGGKLLTIGSDAHNASRIGYGIEEAIEQIKKCGFEEIYYYDHGWKGIKI